MVILTFGIFLTSYFIIKKEKIVLKVDGKEIILNSYCGTVEELLNENNIHYDDNDIIYPSIDSKLKDNMSIKITSVQRITVSEHSRIPYKTITKKDNSLPKGTNKTVKKGKEGRKTIVYEEVYHGDKLVSRIADKEIIREKPVNEVITQGMGTSYASKTIDISQESSNTKESPNTNSGIKSSNTNYSVRSNNTKGNKMTVSATAYSSGTITSTGTRPRWGTIAVDPRIIPYGAKVYIPKFNMTFVAEDCGGGIKGNRIDIFMNSSSACYNWGVRSIDIYIVG